MSAGVQYRGVGFAYPGGPPVLRDVDFDVPVADLLLVIGPSGSGKSTLLRCVNGLVPHSSGGRFRGEVVVGGRSTRGRTPRSLADTVGFVHQDPEAQFVVDQVEADLAFALENLGMAPAAMRRRVEEVLDALGVAHLRDRSPATLSGGERQRCAIAGALATAPSVLVLDEPTSQLDPQGAEDVLAAVARLNTDLGTTVILSEHRLERAAPLAHRALEVRAGGLVGRPGPVAEVVAGYDGAPAVTRLGRLLGWSPPPLTVREARRLVAEHPPPPLPSGAAAAPSSGGGGTGRVGGVGDPVLDGRGLVVALGRRTVLRGLDISVAAGEVLALLGRNGAGKTTLLRALAGLIKPAAGAVTRHGGARPGYVPQDPNTLLLGPTVRHDLETTQRLLGLSDPAAVDRWLRWLGLDGVAARHPRDLSAGQRQRVAIGAVAVGGPDVLLLDEPTRGMDAASKVDLQHAIGRHVEDGGAVVLATHDVELAARVAHRVAVLGDGELVADGAASSVLAGSLFAPQVLRVLPPLLTVEAVEALIRA